MFGIEVLRVQALRVDANLLPVTGGGHEDFVRGQAGLFPGRIDAPGVFGKPGLQFLEAGDVGIDLSRPPVLPPFLQTLLNLVEHLALLRLVAVQLQAKGAQARRIEAAAHHFERSEFFGHEQDPLAPRHGRGDQVGDGLGLAGAGRPFDHQVTAIDGVDQSAVLGAVGVFDQRVAPVHLRHFIDRIFLTAIDNAVPFGLLILVTLQKTTHHRVIEQAVLFRPTGGVEVQVHQQLAEVEQGQGDLPAHPPTGRSARLDHGLNLPEISLGRCALIEVRQGHGKIRPQLLAQRQVGHDLLARVGQPVFVGAGLRVEPPLLQPHRYQKQRGKAGLVVVLAFVPFQKAEGHVEDVGPHLLNGRFGLLGDSLQTGLQLVGIEQRLNRLVRVLGRHFIGCRQRHLVTGFDTQMTRPLAGIRIRPQALDFSCLFVTG